MPKNDDAALEKGMFTRCAKALAAAGVLTDTQLEAYPVSWLMELNNPRARFTEKMVEFIKERLDRSRPDYAEQVRQLFPTSRLPPPIVPMGNRDKQALANPGEDQDTVLAAWRIQRKAHAADTMPLPAGILAEVLVYGAQADQIVTSFLEQTPHVDAQESPLSAMSRESDGGANP